MKGNTKSNLSPKCEESVGQPGGQPGGSAELGGQLWSGLSPVTSSPQIIRALRKASMSGKWRSFRDEKNGK